MNPTETLASTIDVQRLAAASALDEPTRARLGQFMTPGPLARFMASMFQARWSEVRLLDAGAGTGSLTAAFVAEMCSRSNRPETIAAMAYEVDGRLLPFLRETATMCRRAGAESDIGVRLDIRETDFIEEATETLGGGLFDRRVAPRFNCAILNPPYTKIRSDSKARSILSAVGIETTNLYAAFVALAVSMLEPGGEIVAITPRSFCNGPYFRLFRNHLLDSVSFERIHLFDRRDRAFSDDSVLQENMIFHAVKSPRRRHVHISTSSGPGAPATTTRRVKYDDVVKADDPERFIHVVTSEEDSAVSGNVAALPARLEDLGLEVSTGRVVDFRVRAHLRREPAPRTAPLLYPCHMLNGRVVWPKLEGKKPNAVVLVPETYSLTVPRGSYVLVRRFSAKEERRRIVASVLDPTMVDADEFAFENHLNFFHIAGHGIPNRLARGLATFLNSTPVDRYFRQFNGHTQVNASDLRSLRYPARAALGRIGMRIGAVFPDQAGVDAIVAEVLSA